MRKSLKILILTTLAFSLLGAFLPEVYAKLSLSWVGIRQFYLWQLVTYVFVEPGPLSLPFFISLAFNLYLLWMFGSPLLERARTPLFLTLYFSSALAGGLVSLAFPNATLGGATNAVYAILVAWMVVNPGSQLLLFFTISFKSHWLIAILLAITFFIDISASLWLAAATLAASSLFAYLFAILVWREQGPFALLRPFERKLLRMLEKKRPPYQHTKIYDIKSGDPVLDDDQFMDAMLDKISRLGEGALSQGERKRMRAISERRK